MALILVRGENNSKVLSAISDIERHGNLNLITKPKVIDASFADSLVESILNSKLKTKSNIAVAFFVKEDATLSIIQVKKIHPPAHIVVVSEEYDAYNKLYDLLDTAKAFDGYRSHKALAVSNKSYNLL